MLTLPPSTRVFVATQPADGRTVVAGISGSNLLVTRYNTNGSLDTSFGGTGKVLTSFLGGNDTAYDIGFDPRNGDVEEFRRPEESVCRLRRVRRYDAWDYERFVFSGVS